MKANTEFKDEMDIVKDLRYHLHTGYNFTDCPDMADYLQDCFDSYDMKNWDLKDFFYHKYYQLQHVFNHYADVLDDIDKKLHQKLPNKNYVQYIKKTNKKLSSSKDVISLAIKHDINGSQQDKFDSYTEGLVIKRHIENVSGNEKVKHIADEIINTIYKKYHLARLDTTVDADVSNSVLKIASKKHESVSHIVNGILQKHLKAQN